MSRNSNNLTWSQESKCAKFVTYLSIHLQEAVASRTTTSSSVSNGNRQSLLICSWSPILQNVFGRCIGDLGYRKAFPPTFGDRIQIGSVVMERSRSIRRFWGSTMFSNDSVDRWHCNGKARFTLSTWRAVVLLVSVLDNTLRSNNTSSIAAPISSPD